MFVNGTFRLAAGSELVTTNCFAFIGTNGTGSMFVEGGTWEAQYIAVGNGGIGSLTFSGGTTRTRSYLSLGNTPGTAITNYGTGTVVLNGGELITTNTGGIVVSTHIGGGGVSNDGGSGFMTVSNGIWRSSDVYVSNGKLTIAGGVTLLASANYGSLYVGAYSSNGNVLITGGELTVTNPFTAIHLGLASSNYSSRGEMTISNGLWRARSVYLVRRSSTDYPQAETGTGILNIAGGLSVISSNLVIGNDACVGEATVTMTAGSLFVTNSTQESVLEIKSGTFNLRGGLLHADKIVLRNCGRLIHTGGNLVAGSIDMQPNGDADGDGLPNYWEQQNGFNVFDPTTGVEDIDDDGLDNFVEYWLGSDPRDAGDPMRITGVHVVSNDVHVTWKYVPPPGNSYKRYAVEATPSLTSTWFTVS
ncbi:MAG: hypothetical protein ACK4UN_12500, partial [Limisphaerales bacterium]